MMAFYNEILMIDPNSYYGDSSQCPDRWDIEDEYDLTFSIAFLPP